MPWYEIMPLDDLWIGETGELVEVLLCRKRLAVLGEELHEDLAEDRLVVRERSVEVEDERTRRHRLRIVVLADADVGSAARARGRVRARPVERPARTRA